GAAAGVASRAAATPAAKPRSAAAKPRNAAAVPRPSARLRIDLDGDKDGSMRMPAGRRCPDVGFDRESPGRARGEGHLRDRARFELLLDVVAVKVHAQRLVRA